jgi:recombinational DNA repair protein RecR
MARFLNARNFATQRQRLDDLRDALADRLEASMRARTCINCESLQENQGSYSCSNEDVNEVDSLPEPATFGCLYFARKENP